MKDAICYENTKCYNHVKIVFMKYSSTIAKEELKTSSMIQLLFVNYIKNSLWKNIDLEKNIKILCPHLHPIFLPYLGNNLNKN